MHSPNTHEVGRISSYWIRDHPPLDSCFVDFPHHVASKFPIVRLRHFYSDDTMAGICVGKPLIADTELSIADYHARHHNLDTPFNGNYRDVRIPQIEYVTQLYCSRCSKYWERCRCVDNVTRLSALMPDPRVELAPEEIVRISCVECTPRLDGRDTEPVYRHGVRSAAENRPEFIVHLQRRTAEPQLACKPRLYQSFKGQDYGLQVER